MFIRENEFLITCGLGSLNVRTGLVVEELPGRVGIKKCIRTTYNLRRRLQVGNKEGHVLNIDSARKAPVRRKLEIKLLIIC